MTDYPPLPEYGDIAHLPSDLLDVWALAIAHEYLVDSLVLSNIGDPWSAYRLQLTTGDDARPAKRCICYYEPICNCGADCGPLSFWINDRCPHHGGAASTICRYCDQQIREEDWGWNTEHTFGEGGTGLYCPTSPDRDHHPDTQP
jgi:hypothetical protein